MRLELAQRHAHSKAKRALVPAPPLVVGLLAMVAVVWLVTRRGTR